MSARNLPRVQSDTARWPGWPQSSAETIANLEAVAHSERWSISGAYRGSPSFERRFSRAFAEFCDVEHCTPTSSGTGSLTVALEACGVGAYDEVIVPGISWVASASAVVGVNAVPVLVDVDPNTFTLDPVALADAITDKTRAISVVHLYSAVADLDAILEVAARHELPVIEDCAQAHGARYRGRHVGGHGTVGAFSMQHSKLLTSGEGGAVITNDSTLARRAEHLRADGRTFRGDPVVGEMELHETAELMGSNWCLSEFHAAIALAQLEELPAQTERRAHNARLLDEMLEELGCTPQRTADKTTTRAYYRYAVQLPQHVVDKCPTPQFVLSLRERLQLAADRCNAPLNGCRLYAPSTRRRFALSADYQQQIANAHRSLPNAELVSRRTVTLPHACLLASPERMREIADAFAEAIDGV